MIDRFSATVDGEETIAVRASDYDALQSQIDSMNEIYDGVFSLVAEKNELLRKARTFIAGCIGGCISRESLSATAEDVLREISPVARNWPR